MAQQSLLAAVSGIQANQTYLDEVANNIANVNTVGYKAGSVQFQDLLSQQLSGASAPAANGTSGGINPVAIGSGVRVGSNQLNLSEGTLMQTGQNTDVAINGNGYLVVEQGGQQLYTRNGSLTMDANGNLVTQGGGIVQGWPAGASASTPIGAITIPQNQSNPAQPTSNVTISGNLPSWDGTGTAPTLTKTVDTYDALGNVVPLTLTFTAQTPTGTAPSITAYNWKVTGTYGSATTPTFTENLSFKPNGTLATPAASTASSTTTPPTDPYSFLVGDPNLPSTGGTAAQINLSFASSTGTNGVTGYAGASSIAVTQNGYASGSLSNFSIGADGTITGSFSNGQTLALGQIALANFANPAGLTDQGAGNFAASPNSGQPQVGVAGTGGRGQLLGGELEQSNVNLGTELTDLINAQEAYTANTKVLTATNVTIQALEAV